MSEKPEALVLADAFAHYAAIPADLPKGVAIPCVISRAELFRAAAELRRQHAENERLLGEVRRLTDIYHSIVSSANCMRR